MKKLFALLALALGLSTVQAQTVITIVGQTCNVAQNICVLQGDSGQAVVLDISPSAVYMTIDGVPYSGTTTSEVQTQATNFYRSYDVTMTFTPTAVVEGAKFYTRSGSGRGGWAWHQHWDFETITVY
jgi:hypothetical protein